MAKDVLRNSARNINKLVVAPLMAVTAALSTAALTGCDIESKRPAYCVVDDGERMALPTFGTMDFPNSEAYRNNKVFDRLRLGEQSTKEYFLTDIVNRTASELESGTPMSVSVTAASVQEEDARLLAYAVKKDLDTEGLNITSVDVTVEEQGTGGLNPLITVQPVCNWNE